MKLIVRFVAVTLVHTSVFAFEFSQIKTPKQFYDRVGAGLDVNTKNDEGFTLLHHAAHFQDPALLKFLIGKGANMYAVDQRGETPFAVAISYTDAAVMKTFLDAGFDPNTMLKRPFAPGMTHFQYYLQKDYKIKEPSYRLFLAKKADIEARDEYGRTALIFAADFEYERIETSRLLIRSGARINAQDKEGRTALLQAATTQNVELIKELLQAGADVNLRNATGETALKAIVRRGNLDEGKPAIARLLLDAGTRIDTQDEAGYTALADAAIARHVELVTLLCERGADVSLQNGKGISPLAQAIINKAFAVIRILLKYEKDLNRLDKYGSTMLHSAVLNKEYELARLYMEAGADVNAKDKWGKTVLEFARMQNDPQMMAILEGR